MSTKKTTVKKQTVRERSQIEPKAPRRHLKTSAKKPLAAVGGAVKTTARPLKPVLRPFKTRPLRFVGHVLATVLLVNYLRSSWRELVQVTWPDRKSTFKLTIAVFVFAIIFGAIIATADYGLDKLFHKILLS